MVFNRALFHTRWCGLPGSVPALRVIPCTPLNTLLIGNHSNQQLGKSPEFSDSQPGSGRTASVLPAAAKTASATQKCRMRGLLFICFWWNHNAQVQPRRSEGRQVHRPYERRQEPEQEQGGGVLRASFSSQESLEGHWPFRLCSRRGRGKKMTFKHIRPHVGPRPSCPLTGGPAKIQPGNQGLPRPAPAPCQAGPRPAPCQAESLSGPPPARQDWAPPQAPPLPDSTRPRPRGGPAPAAAKGAGRAAATCSDAGSRPPAG